ncbi:MAG TPA: hypothetical protein VMH79_07490 [Thermoanaerobaculia bacterium]|nr:hypothetical protein [Thermoanaerobaculia bacterium]
MFETLALVFGVVFLLSLLPLLWITVRRMLRERGPRVITCPDNGCRAEVSVDAWKSGLAHVFGEGERRLASCSRWPAMQGCDQACLTEIEESPDGCLVRTMVADWYGDRACAACGLAVHPFGIGTRPPALRDAAGRTLALSTVTPLGLDATLASHEPICANCYDALAFREQFPGLAIERPHPPDAAP